MFENIKNRINAFDDYMISKRMFKDDERYFVTYISETSEAIGALCYWYALSSKQLYICKNLGMKKLASFWSNVIVKANKACAEFYGIDVAEETCLLMKAIKAERKENENEEEI